MKTENVDSPQAVAGQVDCRVRPLGERLRMHADNKTKQAMQHDCEQAAEWLERLAAALKKANEQAERFERGWYLRGDALEVAVRQNSHDMLMTGEELRACEAALAA
jgi:hypothetical protein